MLRSIPRVYRPLCWAVLWANLGALALLGLRILATGETRFWFLPWNLLLGWVPFLAAVLAHRTIRKSPGIQIIAWLSIWLLFLPNSFYLLTDFIHLRHTGEINILYDIVLLFAFVWNGFLAGVGSVYLVHRLLMTFVRPITAHAMIALSFVACGYAIYLGRVLRWNSWDVVSNPAGLLFDVSESLINPLASPQILVTTGIFFAIINICYWPFYFGIQALRSTKQR